MKLGRILTTPPPTTSWSVDGDVVVAARRDGRGQLFCASHEVPSGTFEHGPVGLQSVVPAKLEPVVRSLQERVAGAKRAAVVLPTGWLRSHLLDFDQLPRKRAEIDDVVRWRLKRLLPVPPAELRISWVQVGGPEGSRRLLTSVGFRRALDTFEEVLVASGVEPGLIASRLLAISSAVPDGASPALLIQAEPGFLSLLLSTGGVPELLRTKPVRAGGVEGLDRELALALRYIRDSLEVTSELEVRISSHDSALEAAVRTWVESGDGLREVPMPAAFAPAEPGSTASIAACRLRPLEAVIGGAT